MSAQSAREHVTRYRGTIATCEDGSMTDARQWGRIADDGTVYVRDAGGEERVIGSWQAGTADEGFEFYGRRYDDLAAEVGILEARIAAPGADPKAIAAAVRKLQEALPTAPVMGDLGG